MKKKMNLKLTTNRILFVVAIAGMIVTGALNPGGGNSKDSGVTFSLPSQPAPDPNLPLPPAKPREWGLNPFDRPFLFRLGSTDKMTALEREGIVAAQYHQILTGLGDKVPEVEVKDYSGVTGVAVGGKPLVTVLAADCPEYYGRLSDEAKKRLEHQVAEQWKHLLQMDLAGEALLRSPVYLRNYPYIVSMLFFLCLLLHVLADAAARRWMRSPAWSLKLLIWLGWLSACFFLHPFLKPMAATLGRGALRPVFLALLIGTLMNLLFQVSCLIFERYIKSYRKGHLSEARQEQRIATLTQGGRFLIGTVAVIWGTAWFLFAVGVPVHQFFAGAGLAGIALSVIGRDILIDYFYGINILLGDYFSIGDWIEAGPVSGTVVSFNLRSTQIREIDGGLSIVTNGMLNRLKNHSREWANTDFRVGVAYGSDPDRCLALILEEIEGLAEAWPEKLEKKPVLSGVQELAESAVMLRALVKTAPLAQWEVGRELNRRVLLRFGREGVEIPFPQRKIWIEKEKGAL
ncbi:MAG: mechanosensitive ion channel family protein [Candidatus Eremiobacteraeota bacterium]|nr:mechanosensitive ion channel family protein [Candidatus Eremiobacteraeota bacterium]